MFDDTEVMGNEKVGISVPSLKFCDEVEDLGLNGNIQSGGGLIEDDKFRSGDQGSCDPDPLPLSPAKFMGITVHVIFIKTHLAEDGLHPGNHLGPFGNTVYFKGIADGLFDEHPWVEGRLRILEDNLQIFSDLLEFVPSKGAYIDTLEKNVSPI